MATTTNYGWTTPDDTALVKDGASAIRSLGSAIDTSMNTALGTKKAGLVLLNTTSFSAVSSQSVNDVFSATYNNYRIQINYKPSSAGARTITFRLRASGSDAATDYYYGNGGWVDNNTAYTDAGSATTSFLICSTAYYGEDMSISFDLFNPQTTAKTLILGQSTLYGSARIGGQSFYGFHNVASAYTGFTIISSLTNITGTAKIYGYN